MAVTLMAIALSGIVLTSIVSMQVDTCDRRGGVPVEGAAQRVQLASPPPCPPRNAAVGPPR
jgi:hypothetical protein